MTLIDLRDAIRALLPHTTIDIAGNRLLVTLAEPIHVIGIAVREDFSDYELGAADVRRPSRSMGRTKATPERVADSIRGIVRARLSNLHNAGVYGLPWQQVAYAKGLSVVAASDFAHIALHFIDSEMRVNAEKHAALDAEMAKKKAALDKEAEAIAERRRALVMLAPGYAGPKLEPLSEYVDDEPLLDEGDDGEA